MNNEYDIELLKEREAIHNRLMSEGAQKIEELIAQRAELESQLARLGNEKVEMAKRLTALCELMKVARNERQASPLSADHHVASEIEYWHDRIQEILK